MNKKGFTLIELLAVIIILGILMIIAIPSVTKYISDSRKNAYVDTAKEVIGSARNLVNSGSLEMYDTDATYYMDVKCISTENAMKSPYGEFVDMGAFVVVTYNGQGYDYFWTSVDDAGQGIKDIISYEKLEADNVESDITIEDISTLRTIDGRSKVILITERNGCKKEGAIENNLISVSSNAGSGNSSGGNISQTAAQQIGSISSLINVADAKRYVGSNPDNYVKFNGNELWRIIGIYGDNLKIIKANRLNEFYKYNNSQSDGNEWEGSNIETYLNNTYYNSFSNEAKNMIEQGTWYVGKVAYGSKASTAYDSAKSKTWSGKVGLIASYEYLYAAPNTCYETAGNLYDSGCGSNDWLLLSDDRLSWTINPNYEYSMFASYLFSDGTMSSGYVTEDSAACPVVYLKSTVKITGGLGTSTSPYTLSM